jgi:hypothetical protein
MMNEWRAAICSACHIHHSLPCNETSIVTGNGTRFFHTHAANVICICPRLSNGACATYVMIEDVCLAAADACDARPILVRTQVQVDSGSGNISIAYFIVETGRLPKEMRLCVYVCGVLLIDVRVHKVFGGELCSQHALEPGSVYTHYDYVAIHPAGTHLAISDCTSHCVCTFALPNFQVVNKLGSRGTGSAGLRGPRGLCFTDIGTLLIADHYNDRVQHWTLHGTCIASYHVLQPWRVAAHSNLVAIGCIGKGGVHIFSLDSDDSDDVISSWLCGSSITAIAFVDATTLAIANYTSETIGLYTLEGALKKQFRTDIISHCLMCAEDCLLVVDWRQKRVCVFSMDGFQLDASPFAAQLFTIHIHMIALFAERVFVLENIGIHASRICAFE